MKKEKFMAIIGDPEAKTKIVPLDTEKEITLSHYPTKKSVAGVKLLTKAPLVKNLSFLQKWKLKKNPHKSNLVTIFLKNNSVSEFFITTNENRFQRNGKTYILAQDEARMNHSLAQNHYFYYEDCAMPVNRDVQFKGEEAWFSVTPSNLKPYIEMQVVEKLVGSSDINKYLKMLVLITAIGTMGAVVSTLLLLNQLRMATGK